MTKPTTKPTSSVIVVHAELLFAPAYTARGFRGSRVPSFLVLLLVRLSAGFAIGLPTITAAFVVVKFREFLLSLALGAVLSGLRPRRLLT